MRAGEFKSKNTIRSTQLPTFASVQQTERETQHPTRYMQHVNDRSFINEQSLPQIQPLLTYSPPSNYDQFSFQEIGNSSSLFDSSFVSIEQTIEISESLSDFVAPVILSSRNRNTWQQAKDPSRTMVNERSPAKAPLQVTKENLELLQQGEPAKPVYPSSVPKFGETNMPQSPLSRKVLESQVFIQPKPPRQEYQKEYKNSIHPHLHTAKDFAKAVIDPFIPKSISTQSDPRYGDAKGNGVPIPRPVNDASFSTTRPWQQPAFGSSGNTYGGFQAVNAQFQPANFVDLTGAGYRDHLAPAESYSFVDPSKATADLKALLEGAIEDEDDVPRTRLKKNGMAGKADGLVTKLKYLAVTSQAVLTAAQEGDGDEDDDGTVEGIKVKLLPHQIEGLSWMRDRELGTRKKGVVPKGGILADDMGLGKTLQSIALILTNPKPKDSDVEDGKRRLPPNMDKCTLVVAPLALIRQWELEIKDKVEYSHQLRVCVHHGPQRTKRFQDLKKYDVVITTYQILVSEYGSSSKDVDGLKVGCFGLHWYRVILDEAHTIKNRNAKATQACYALRSEYRWCLTGTPMQNNLDELQSLIKFLRIKPYDDLKEWKDQIDRPMKNGRGDLAIKRLQHYLKIFMKRRTKDVLKQEGALNPGGKVLAAGDTNTTGFKVTERKIEKVFAKFSPQERLFYDRLEQRADKSLEEMMGGEKINYASALVLLLRLRQACNHPRLVAGKLGKDGEAIGVDAGNATQIPRKSKIVDADIDEMANMFGGLGVGSKKCDACGNELNKELIKSGAVHCKDCEADLALIQKKKSSKTNSRHHEKLDKSQARQARNRAVIMDSEDEDNGEWIVGEGDRGPKIFGKAGGTDDENAEGEGISVGSDDSDESDIGNVEYTSRMKEQKEIITIDDSRASDTDDDESEVEADYISSSEEEEEEEAELSTVIVSTKITHLLKILAKEAAQHKFIVFSQFTSMLDLIEPFLKRDGYKYTRYDGSMKNELREASLARLRNDRSCRVLLCSLKCGSLGLNLTAATRVVILEPFWNPFVEEQAIDRVHRLTQKTDVIVYKITIENSVEERILELQEKKRELANQAIEGGAKANIGKLGMKEIMQLFRRDAEYTPQNSSAYNYTTGVKSRVLTSLVSTSEGDSVASSRESSVIITGERRATPPIMRHARNEDQIYGRRW